MHQGCFFLLTLSTCNFDDQISQHFHRFVMLRYASLCWDTPSENGKGVRTLRSFATSYPGHFVPFEVTKCLWTLRTLDTSYLGHFVPSPETPCTFSRDTSYLQDFCIVSGFLHPETKCHIAMCR